MRRAVGAAVGLAGYRRELALEELVERRARVAHDVAVEPEQRLGDLGAVGVELERVRQEAHALHVGLDHRAQALDHLRVGNVRDERLFDLGETRLRHVHGVLTGSLRFSLSPSAWGSCG